VAPLRRKSAGSITPEFEWLHYAEILLAPLCRNRIGSIVPKVHNRGTQSRPSGSMFIFDLSQSVLLAVRPFVIS